MGGRGSTGDRWAVITKDDKLMWFDHVMPPDLITEKHANGYVGLSGVKVGTNPAKKLTFAIAPNTGKCTPPQQLVICFARTHSVSVGARVDGTG